MRLCKVDNCNKKHYGLGYYQKHYIRFKKYGNPLKTKRLEHSPNCKFENCKNKYYAREYCHKHYFKMIYYPIHKKNISLQYHEHYLKVNHGLRRKKCKARNCQFKATRPYQYCYRHRRRIKSNLPLDLSINGKKLHAPRGNKNFMWKGGVAEYPNHYLMKKQRLIILMNNPKCEYCGKPATEIHHKDEKKSNHELSNLAATCRSCNLKQSSRFYKRFGYTLTEIAQILGKSSSYWAKHLEEIKQYL